MNKMEKAKKIYSSEIMVNLLSSNVEQNRAAINREQRGSFSLHVFVYYFIFHSIYLNQISI